LASLYILEVTCFIRKYCQTLEHNSKVHNYNTRSRIDMHLKVRNIEVHKTNLINMGTRLYNNLPGFIKEIDDCKALKKELKLFLLHHFFYSLKNLYLSSNPPVNLI
jgi:hypothetical protein